VNTDKLKDVLEALESVICDLDGKSCIEGSVADNMIVDGSLSTIRQLIAEREAAVPMAEVLDDCQFVAFKPLPAGTKLFTAPQPAPTVPEGWRPVPVEPTDEMVEAAMAAGLPTGFAVARKRIRAAISAAPTPDHFPDATKMVPNENDIADLYRVVDDFNGANETEASQETLIRLANIGLLECTYFEVTPKGRDLLDATPTPGAKP
jgi:hypothetical protein